MSRRSLEHMRRDGQAFGRQKLFEAFGRLAQLHVEAADAQPDQGCLQLVHEATALAAELLVLTARALGVLLRKRRDRHHAAMLPFATQPAQKAAHQQLGVEPVRLAPPMFARHRDAAGMDHIGLDPMSSQPARQPETVAPGLEGHRHPLNRPASLHGLLAPAMQYTQDLLRIRIEFFRG
jgi:hypothetical protein